MDHEMYKKYETLKKMIGESGSDDPKEKILALAAVDILYDIHLCLHKIANKRGYGSD